MTVAEPIERREERASAAAAPSRAARAARTSPTSDRRARFAGAGCLVGVAAAHAFDVPSHLESSPYLGYLFIGLIVSSLGLAGMLVRNWHVELAWPVSALLAANAMAGYLWSRTIGLPQIEDHVGEWRDAFGTASLVFEVAVIGLGLSALRPAATRVASGAAFLGSGLLVGGVLLGAAGGHGGHGGGGHHEGMNVDAATPAQQAEARRLQADTVATARTRFPTFDAAKAAGYKFAPRPFEKQKDLDFWHLTNRGYLNDKRNLNPRRPETLMFWKNPDGKPELMATVYRVPTKMANPSLGGPILQWHLHRNRMRKLGKYKMTHLWHLPRMKDAYSMSMPVTKFQRQRRFENLPINGSGAGT